MGKQLKRRKARAVIVMGVSGSGKSTVGEALARKIGARFFDADDFHSEANIAKMATGKGLDDADRAPWLDRLNDEVIRPAKTENPRVLACSALKKVYRDRLAADGVEWLYLKGTRELLTQRLEERAGHFMKEQMLDGQLRDLEPPECEEAIICDIALPIEEIVIHAAEILKEGST